MNGITLTKEQIDRIDSLLQDIADGYFTYVNDDDAELPDNIPGDADAIRSILGLPDYDAKMWGGEPDVNDDFPLALEYDDNDPRDDEVAREEAAMEWEMFGSED